MYQCLLRSGCESVNLKQQYQDNSEVIGNLVILNIIIFTVLKFFFAKKMNDEKKQADIEAETANDYTVFL